MTTWEQLTEEHRQLLLSLDETDFVAKEKTIADLKTNFYYGSLQYNTLFQLCYYFDKSFVEHNLVKQYFENGRSI